jgi:hypothetical protein
MALTGKTARRQRINRRDFRWPDLHLGVSRPKSDLPRPTSPISTRTLESLIASLLVQTGQNPELRGIDWAIMFQQPLDFAIRELPIFLEMTWQIAAVGGHCARMA